MPATHSVLFVICSLLLLLAGCGSGSTSTAISPVTPAPDLKPTGIDFDPEPALLGQSFDIDVTVANTGGLDAGSFAVRVRVLDNFGNIQHEAKQVLSSGMSASQAEVVSFGFTLSNDSSLVGTWSAVVMVDSDEQVAEVNGSGAAPAELNNTDTWTFDAVLAGST